MSGLRAAVTFSLVFLLTIQLSGCGSLLGSVAGTNADKKSTTEVNKSVQAGNYEDVLKLLETKDFNQFQGSIFTLDNLCTANLKLGKFQDFFACVDSYEQRLPTLPLARALEQYSGTFYYHKADDNYSSPSALEIELKGRPHRLKAEAYFMLGDYAEVVRQVEQALAIYRPDEEFWSCRLVQNRGDCLGHNNISRIKNKNSPWHDDLFAVAALGAMAHALQGEQELAQPYIKRITTLHQDPVDGKDLHAGMHRMRQTHLNNINFALGNYADVKLARQNQGEKNLKLLGQGMQVAYWSGAAAIGALAAAPVLLVPALLAFSFMGHAGMALEKEADFNMTAEMALRELFQNAKVEEKTGFRENALEIYRQMLAAPLIASMPELHWMTLYDNARLLAEDGNQSQAITQLRQAVDVIEQQRGNINSEAHKIGFAGSKEGVYQRLVKLLIETGQFDPAFEYVERAKARALVDMLAASSERPDQNIATFERPELAALSRGRIDVTAATPADGRIRSIALSKKTLRVEQPSLASLVTVQADSADQLRNQLSPDETLLEYYLTGETLYVFVINRDRVQVFPLDAKGLASAVETLRAAIQTAVGQDYLQPARELYQRLIEPLQGALTTKRLTIVAHGALHYLPFAALHDGREFLLDRFNLRMLPSVSVLKYLTRTQSGKKPLLAFGNPTGDLPGAEAEVRALDKQMPTAHTLLNAAATETAFKERAGGYNILHIASHGEFNPHNPLASRLLLAPDNRNDGSLTVAELYDQQIDAELVILSACETGLGEINNGDDVIGLNRGFLFAGAESIVSTLWTVDDDATKQLMLNFYAQLALENRAEALRKAQIFVKKRINPHPFYWAAFQLTGRVIKI